MKPMNKPETLDYTRFEIIHTGGSEINAPYAPRPDKFGGKGVSLYVIARAGLKAPPAFIISTDLFLYYFSHNKNFPSGFREQIVEHLEILQLSFQDFQKNRARPFTVSVRTGAAVSMPGMTDSVLNVGMNDENYRLASRFFASDRIAGEMYSGFVELIAESLYCITDEEEEIAEDARLERIRNLKDRIFEESGEKFPDLLIDQVMLAIRAALESHQNPRAMFYRQIQNISVNDSAPAIIVQAMVYGNSPGLSGSGVGLSRDPFTGDAKANGEYCLNMQGDHIVGGKKTPLTLEHFKQKTPTLYKKLSAGLGKLERVYHDITEAEFTFENGELWFLQARPGKSGAAALLKITADLFIEKAIDEATAILRVNPRVCETFLHPAPDPAHPYEIIERGVPASPGAVSGKIVFTSEDAAIRRARGENVILVRNETAPDDIHGLYAASGILTLRGGATSHAAVAARGLGRPCVTGASGVKILLNEKRLLIGERSFKEGDEIMINGSNGDIIAGAPPTILPDPPEAFFHLSDMARRTRRMKLRANADSAEETAIALRFGAEGVGLCRSEQILYGSTGVNAVCEMILAETSAERVAAFSVVREHQIELYSDLFQATFGLPVTVRLLDPPLHEFFPDTEKGIQELADKLNKPFAVVNNRLNALHEYNPMLGHRGCRVGISHPEIYAEQTRIICKAAARAAKATGLKSKPEFMIPFISFAKEYEIVSENIRKIALYEQEKCNHAFEFKIGAVIELPRAALRADVIAEKADFISFGTNDLTQTVLGVSRDDSARFLADYRKNHILNFDPFESLDMEGVGFLIELAVKRARSVKPEIEIGVCGEHAADAQSVLFFEKVGADYLSCSPYRVAAANFSAAQATLKTT